MDRLFIFYAPGSYGSWLEWIVQYSHEHYHKQSLTSPLLQDGSSHNHNVTVDYSMIMHPGGHQNIKNSLNYKNENFPLLVFRAIPKITEDESIADIVNFASKTENCIYVSVNDDEMREVVLLNWDQKIKNLEDTFFSKVRFKNWKESASTLNDLDVWEKRECLSLCYHESIKNLTSLVSPLNDSVLVIDIREILFGNVEVLLRKIFSFFSFPLREESIAHVVNEHKKMISLQRSLIEIDAVTRIINGCKNWENIDIPDLTVLSEAYIQKRLRDLGYDLKCYGLNKFPKTTHDLMKLLVKY